MRVAVVVHREETGTALAAWAWRFARSLEATLTVVWLLDRTDETVVVGPEEDDDAFEALPDGVRRLLEEVVPEESPSELATGDEDVVPPLPHPLIEVVWPAGMTRLGAVLAAFEDLPPDVLLVSPPREKRRRSLARRLFTAASCDTVFLRPGETTGRRCRGILVPTAGGPSARRALVLGDRLAAAEGARLDALFVEPEAVEEGEAVGLRILDRALAGAGLGDSPRIERRVALGDDLTDAIEAAVRPGEHDLVLLGASHASGLRALLFGTVPERLLATHGGVAVGVVRERWSWSDRLRARVGRWLDLRIPQLGREERVALYQRLQSGSAWSFDFMLLIALSTTIAALGLVQGSAAVVIGAMLVAPLMTPILGMGLAILQGNAPLLLSSFRSVVSGYLLALAVGMATGWLAGADTPTSELLARGGPTLLDMGVGFFAGVAAAYCLGRPGLLAALPGVAIAAALVPPIATTGIALASGWRGLAAGSSLLFGTNVVAIVVGAAVALYAVGLRGRREPTTAQRRMRHVFVGFLVVLGLLAVPLAGGWIQAADPSVLDADVASELRTAVEEVGLSLAEAGWTVGPEGRLLRVVVASPAPVDRAELEALAARLQGLVPGAEPLRVVAVQSVEARLPSPVDTPEGEL